MEERSETRAAVSLVARYGAGRGRALSEEGVGTNLSREGLFIGTRRPLAKGKHVRIDCEPYDREGRIRGMAEVVWTRRQGDGENRPAGMGLRFVKLEPSSTELIEAIIRTGDAGSAGAAARQAPTTEADGAAGDTASRPISQPIVIQQRITEVGTASPNDARSPSRDEQNGAGSAHLWVVPEAAASPVQTADAAGEADGRRSDPTLGMRASRLDALIAESAAQPGEADAGGEAPVPKPPRSGSRWVVVSLVAGVLLAGGWFGYQNLRGADSVEPDGALPAQTAAGPQTALR